MKSSQSTSTATDRLLKRLERLPPKTLVWLLVFVILVYLVWPWDVLPDWAGALGRLDDLAVALGVGWLYWSRLKKRPEASGPNASNRESGESQARPDPSPDAFDPYAVLGIAPSADADAIRSAYRARMQEYHPDKVAHLGADLQALANEKTREIQRAYALLSR
jgi:uncharacterized membrane protein YkvA (DUF1232 family)